MKTLRSILLLAAIATALATTRASGAEPCHADVEKLCAGTPAGGGGIQACIKSKEAELSEPCKKQLDEVKGRVGPLVAACRYDIALLCPDVPPGGGRIATCLEAKRDRLSAECKTEIGKSAPH